MTPAAYAVVTLAIAMGSAMTGLWWWERSGRLQEKEWRIRAEDRRDDAELELEIALRDLRGHRERADDAEAELSDLVEAYNDNVLHIIWLEDGGSGEYLNIADVASTIAHNGGMYVSRN